MSGKNINLKFEHRCMPLFVALYQAVAERSKSTRR